MRTGKLNNTIFHLVLAAVGLVNLFPLYFMVTGALRDRLRFSPQDLGVPSDPHWENFAELFDRFGFARLFANSLIITVIAVLISIVVAALAAYAFSQLSHRLLGFSFNLIVALNAVPPIVVIVPIFVQLAGIGLINNLLAPILVYVGFLLPFNILLLRNYFETIPHELLESARVEGANELTVIWRVIVPLARPPIVALGIVDGLWVWNELLIAVMLLQREEIRTLAAGIALFSTRQTSDLALQLAGSVVATLPLVLIYVFAQRAFTRGLVAGAFR